MRQSHVAGEKLFVDFPGDTVPVWDRRTGEVVMRAELFVAVLGASNYLYAEAFASQELLYWVTAHVHCFEALGGCPAIVVCDNLRSGVTRPHRYEPDVNATFAEMAAWYGVAVIPARAYKPRDKAKAESGVLLAERWIIARLRDRRFYSLPRRTPRSPAASRRSTPGRSRSSTAAGRACSSSWTGRRCGRCPPPGMSSRPGTRPA